MRGKNIQTERKTDKTMLHYDKRLCIENRCKSLNLHTLLVAKLCWKRLCIENRFKSLTLTHIVENILRIAYFSQFS